MDFNINMKTPAGRKKSYGLIFVGVVIIFLAIKYFSTPSWNKWLKNDIKENFVKIDSLEKTKEPIFLEIKKKDIEIAKKDSIILDLSKQRVKLLKSLNYYRNENLKIKDAYLNNSINKRIELFAKLAIEKDTIPKKKP